MDCEFSDPQFRTRTFLSILITARQIDAWPSKSHSWHNSLEIDEPLRKLRKCINAQKELQAIR